MAAKLDAQLLSASGDGITTPKGLFAYSGTQSVVVSGAITLDALLDAWGKALAANVNLAALRWVMQPREFVKLRSGCPAPGRSPRLGGPRVGGTPTARAALVDFWAPTG